MCGLAGLFVIVEAVNAMGALANGVRLLRSLHGLKGTLTAGFGIALLSNQMNNLPSGLLSGAAVRASGVQGAVRDAILVGVDLGPNLSISGSPTIILWLIAIRREVLEISFWRFLKVGRLGCAAGAGSGNFGVVGKFRINNPSQGVL